MKNIKRLTYYVMLFSIVLGACGSQDKADAEQLEEINEQVESLYNEEINDLATDASVETFEGVEESIQAVDEAELNEENAKRFEEIEGFYNNAVDMYTLEEEIQDLFVDEIVVEEVQLDDLAELSARLVEIDQEQWTSYVSRQEEQLAEAEEQLEHIKVAKELVDQFYLEGDRINRQVTREEESIAKEAVAQVKNQTVREELEKRLAKVDQTLTKVEEEYQQATDGVGFFEGMYLSYDNIILYVDEIQYFLAENVANDNFVYYEVTEIISNTGKELKLGLYEQPMPNMDIEGGSSTETLSLSDDYNTITTERGFEYERLTQAEIEEIFEELPGIKNTLERSRDR